METDGISRETKDSFPADPRGDGDRLLADYMRDLGSAPLLERELEASHAAELQESRESLSALMDRLPPRYREFVINGAAPADGERWRLHQLDGLYRRLCGRLDTIAHPRVVEVLREARGLKVRLDRSRDALIVSNLRFVAHVAKRLSSDRTSYLDLIQEGNLGLIEAVERFEFKRGHRFATYAYWWIRRAMFLSLAGRARTIYVPAHVRRRLARLGRASAEMAEELGRGPTEEELAQRLDLSVRQVKRALAVVQQPQPLESMGDPDRGDPLLQIPDPLVEDPLKGALDREVRQKVGEALQELRPDERRIIHLRFGIGDSPCLTLRQIGARMGMSRERVRQIERNALKKLLDSPQARSFRRERGGRQSRQVKHQTDGSPLHP